MSQPWRNPRVLQLFGMIATVIWLTHVGLTTGFEPAHPLFYHIFIVPLAGWIIITLIIKRLERGARN